MAAEPKANRRLDSDADEAWVSALSRVVTPEIPGVLPDNRVSAGNSNYNQPMLGLLQSALFIRGMVSDLNLQGVPILKQIADGSRLQRMSLVIAIYGGSRTWNDVLTRLLRIQIEKAGRVEFRILARKITQDRPANLIWIQRSESESGEVITGNVGNLLSSDTWDPTDAVAVFRLDAAALGAVRKWFDNVHAHGRALTRRTAAAPRLEVPSGNRAGELLWKRYLKILDTTDSKVPSKVVVDPETGEITEAADPTPSQHRSYPQPDPVILEVQKALAKGKVISISVVDRVPPLAAPLRPEWFGETTETRSGAASRQQTFRVKLFDEDNDRTLSRHRDEMSDQLARLSLMLRKGIRWVPDAAEGLLNERLHATTKKVQDALLSATDNQHPERFVESCIGRIAKDCADLADRIAPGRQPRPDLVALVKADLIKRLEMNLRQGTAYRTNSSRVQIPLFETALESPWEIAEVFLAESARFIRLNAPRRYQRAFRLPGSEATVDIIDAFDVFGDVSAAVVIFDEKILDRLRRERRRVDDILALEFKTSRERAHDLYHLIKGTREEVPDDPPPW